MIISITGRKGAGKTTALNYFQALGFKVLEIYETYHGLVDEGKIAPEDVVPNGVWDDSYIKTIHKYAIENEQTDLIFIGGLLRLCELDFLKKKDEVMTARIAIESDKERYDRMRRRGRGTEASYADEDFRLRDLNRDGHSSEKYKDNSLDKLIDAADWRISNDGTLADFEKALFALGCTIGGSLQKGKYWYDNSNRYSESNFAALFNLEALLGGRKRILQSLGKFGTGIALGCNDGRELDLIPAESITGVDSNEEAIKVASKRGRYTCITGHVLDVAGRYEIVTMLRVIGGSRVDTQEAIKKVLHIAEKIAVVSIATAGIDPEGNVKQYRAALNGKISLEEYLSSCRMGLQQGSSSIEEVRTPFEHYFICRR